MRRPELDPRVWYVAQRYEEVSATLGTWGYAIDQRSQRSRWDECSLGLDPVTGLVSLRGVRLQSDGTPNDEITFSVTEWWVRGRSAGASTTQGNTLVGYHYHGQAGQASLRLCLDPERHPEMPYHRHSPDSPDEPYVYSSVTVDEAIEEFEGLVFREAEAERVEL